MSKRKRNPRVVLIENLTQLLKAMQWQRDHWKYHSQTKIYSKEISGWRLRLPEEYIQAKPKAWLALADHMDQIAAACKRVAMQAREEADKLEGGE